MKKKMFLLPLKDEGKGFGFEYYFHFIHRRNETYECEKQMNDKSGDKKEHKLFFKRLCQWTSKDIKTRDT